MIMSALSKPTELWDIDWNYKQGDLTEIGFEKVINGNASGTITESGLLLNSGGGFVRYSPPIVTARIVTLEAVANFVSCKYNRRAGFKVILSNGDKGLTIYNSLYGLGYEDNSTGTNNGKFLINFPTKVDVKIRLEFDENKGNKVFVNDEMLLETSNFSTLYTSANRVFQQNGGQTLLKELRYKFEGAK